MAEFTQIKSRRLILRRFADPDLESFLAYRNDPEVARYQSWDSCGREEAVAFIQEMKSSRPGTPGEWFQFAVELRETGGLVGDCALKVEKDYQYQAEIGFTLSREHQGKGYASEAVSRLLDYAFGDLGLHRVIAIAFCENERSVALLERLSMRREGRLLQSARFEGGWSDECMYAILGDEWESAT
ncbi:MAG: GNAT family N-acetyltransferase [Rubrobacter sp.]|nr:GNAT family N-acetyltransferase [Rubrobacter sp.]